MRVKIAILLTLLQLSLDMFAFLYLLSSSSITLLSSNWNNVKKGRHVKKTISNFVQKRRRKKKKNPNNNQMSCSYIDNSILKIFFFFFFLFETDIQKQISWHNPRSHHLIIPFKFAKLSYQFSWPSISVSTQGHCIQSYDMINKNNPHLLAQFILHIYKKLQMT